MGHSDGGAAKHRHTNKHRSSSSIIIFPNVAYVVWDDTFIDENGQKDIAEALKTILVVIIEAEYRSTAQHAGL